MNTEIEKAAAALECISVVEKKKKVAIVGFAPSWREAPFEDQEYEVWALNEMYKLAEQMPKFRADRWFEIHDPNSPSKATPEHIQFLQACPVPLYMWDHYDDKPNSVRFPREDIIAWLEKQGHVGARYMSNTISWLIAFALYLDFEVVGIYGVDMSTSGEYGFQKPSCEYFIGIAEGMGKKVIIPESSELLKCAYLYGFESNNKLTAWIKAQVGELGKRSQQFAQQQGQAQQASHQAEIAQAEIRGAKQAYQEILRRRQ